MKTAALPTGTFGVIYADPPWQYGDKSTNRGGALRHYPTMPLKDICAMPVSNIAADDCALFLWCTFPLLFEAREVIESWGFTYKTCAFVWVKTTKRHSVTQTSFLPVESFRSFTGMGHWTRSNVELCLLAVKGKPKRAAADVHQVIYAPIARHSQKPAETRQRIERLTGDKDRIELFARSQAQGWKSWGNEIVS